MIHQWVSRPWSHRLPRFLLAGILFLCCSSVLPSLVLVQGSKEPFSVGDAIEARLSGKNEIAYDASLAAGEYLRVDLCSMGSSLLVVVTNPDRLEAGRWYVDRGFPQPVALIAQSAGNYRFVLKISKGNYSEQTVNLKVVSRRKAVAGDSQWTDISRSLSSAAYFHQQEIADSLSKSVSKYREALQKWNELKDPALTKVYIRCQIGDVLTEMSQYDRALIEYDRADALDTERKLKARTLNSIGYVRLHRHKFQEAATLFSDALKISRSTGDRWSEAATRHNMGAVYYLQEKNREAQEPLNQALAIRQSLNDDLGQANTHLFLGFTYHALKEIKSAQSNYERVLSIGQATEEIGMQGSAYSALGQLMATVGEWQRALVLFDEALKRFKQIGDRQNQYGVLQGMAYGYNGMGEKRTALRFYGQVASGYRLLKDSYRESFASARMAEIYQELDDLDEALKISQSGLQTNRKDSSPYVKALFLTTVGRIYEKQGDASKAREEYLQALGLSKIAEDEFLEGVLLDAIGGTYRGGGKIQEASKYFNDALSIQRSAGDVVHISGTLYDLALTDRDLGRLDSALSRIDEAVKYTESLRNHIAGQDFRASYSASVNQIHQAGIDLRMEAHRQKPNSGWDAAALEASEARARSLLESLVETRVDILAGTDPSSLREEISLKERLDSKELERMNLLSGKHSPEKAAELSKEIDDLYADYHRVRAVIRGRSETYARLTRPQPLRVEEIRREVLDPDTLLLEYSLGEERSYLWVVSDTSLDSYELPPRSAIENAARQVIPWLSMNRDALAKEVAECRRKTQICDSLYQERISELSHMLLGPAAHLLGKKRLLIVAEGALQAFPFAALPIPDQNPATSLLFGHEIVSLPSASVLAAMKREARGRPVPPKMLAVFADPVFENDDPRVLRARSMAKPSQASLGVRREKNSTTTLKTDSNLSSINNKTLVRLAGFSRLPATRKEAEKILALVPAGSSFSALNFDASRSAVIDSQLSQYRVIHFATHGILNSDFPEFSGLALSSIDERGNELDGILRLSDIYNLKLPVDLVVLSACNSGLGKDIRGEGLVGVVRGFMYAGASRVVASLWKVDDDATAELMKSFYQHLFEKGESAAAALRAAQIEISRQKRWQAPYFWAAFVLQGEWK